MVQAARVYGCMEAFRARGCNLVIIDNLQKCGVTEDLDQQRDFVNNVIGLATAMQLHVVVVHHTRKRGAGYHGRISSDDVRGSGAITDMAINTLLVERDFDRAAALSKKLRGDFLTADEQDLLESGCDITLWIQKQKFGTRWNGPIRLWTDGGMTYKTEERGNAPRLMELG
jgi:RecA-family ATPase